MDATAFIYGLTDELLKEAKARQRVKVKPKAKPKGAPPKGKGGAAWKNPGWEAAKWSGKNLAAPALVAGIPLYFGAKAVAEGFGRGVTEEADKKLPYER